MNRETIPHSVLNAFFEHIPTSYTPHGNGHINRTFLAEGRDGKYVVQCLNTAVFPKPCEVMENIAGVSDHIRRKAKEAGRDPERASLTVMLTREGKPYFYDENGDFWRVYLFVSKTVSRDRAESAEDFYICAKAFGEFQRQLADYPVSTLHEPIADFHNTPKRYENLMSAARRDACGRLAEVSAELEFARQRREFCRIFEDAREAGELPLRVTHNDTKLNNILFDCDSGEAVCVVDLDTIMQGYSVTDFGDSIRFGANTAAEDETDLSKVSLDLELFEACVKGFIEGCGGSLTQKEIDLLPEGAMMMTLECGMRFLTDHLDGDVYFKISRDGHNLDRARNQFALLADMEKKLGQMREIVARAVNE